MKYTRRLVCSSCSPSIILCYIHIAVHGQTVNQKSHLRIDNTSMCGTLLNS